MVLLESLVFLGGGRQAGFLFRWLGRGVKGGGRSFGGARLIDQGSEA